MWLKLNQSYVKVTNLGHSRNVHLLQRPSVTSVHFRINLTTHSLPKSMGKQHSAAIINESRVKSLWIAHIIPWHVVLPVGQWVLVV